MTERILDISQSAASLKVRNGLLVIRPDDADEITVPLADLAVVVVSHQQVRYTHAVLCGLAEAGAAFVACNRKHLPAAMLLPLDAHYVQAERFARQAAASRPLQKRLWKQLVQAKVRAQARALHDLRGDDAGLAALALRVRSGDPANVESQAARRYWSRLFDDATFRRAAEDARNSLLNYGYAVLRATVARALCAAGLHPSLGLHHHNRYDAFALADDLMEPLRPAVDRIAAQWWDGQAHPPPKDPGLAGEARRAMIEALAGRVRIEGEQRSLFDALSRTAASLAAAYAGERRDLVLPDA